MRVLLVNPKVSSGWKPYAIPPIGLCSLKAACNGIAEVRVLDASGLPIEKVQGVISSYRPDVVGITTFTEARHNALAVARVAHESGAVTVLGGVHATHATQQILENYPFVDLICRGEGEIAFPEWLVWLDSKGSISSPMLKNLDELPFPDYSDLDLSKYTFEGRPIIAVEASRGCPYDCAFCSSRSMWGSVRFKSVGRVIQELENLVSKYNCKVVSFVDDIFTVNRARTQELCKGIRRLGLTWRCQTRTDCVDRETLQSMKSAGCHLIAFGVESGSPTVLENINKRESPKDVRNAFALCKEVGLTTVFNVIVGSPGETRETLRETRQLIKECRPGKIGTAALRAYPGSRVWALGVRQGLFTDSTLLTKRESIHYEGALTLEQMYRELIKFSILQAQLRGFKGWIELIGMGISVLLSTPGKLVKGVLGE